MAPLMYFSFRKLVLIFLLLVFLNASALSSYETHQQIQSRLKRRMLSDFEDQLEAMLDEKQKSKTKTTPTSTSALAGSNKNQTKVSKPPKVSTKNQTKLITPTSSTKKNQTKPLKPTNSTNPTSTSELKKLTSLSKSSNSTKTAKPTSKIELKKLNSTSKPSNSTKTKTLLDPLIKTPKNKTTPTNQNTKTQKKPTKSLNQPTKQTKPSWIEDDDDQDQDLISEFRDLPIKFQKTLIPDIEKISTTSKAYINQYNKEITTRYLKPIVGKKYAAVTASIVSFIFLLVPLLLVSLVVNHFKAYFSLQKVLIFIQVYLSIYFSILCFSSVVTGLEPLKFFYSTSRSTYICLQVLQTLAYIFYLLILLMYLVLVFSTDSGLGSRMLGLAQTFVGFAVGLHYYVTVFHRVVLRQPPKTNWKIHGIYATCFLVICLLNGVDRRKKAYVEEGGEEGKKN